MIRKKLLSVEHPVVADAQRIDVGLAGVLLVLEDFGSHVEWGAEHGPGPAFFVEDFGEAEVCDFDDPVVPEYVGQFQVPVDDFVFVEVVEAVDEFAHDSDGFVLHQVLFLFDVRVEVSVIAVLEHKVVVVIGLLHVIELDDVGTFTTLQHFYLAFQQLLELPYIMKLTTFDALSSDRLHCDLVVSRSVVTPVYLPVLSRSYLSIQNVVVYQFWHFFINLSE